MSFGFGSNNNNNNNSAFGAFGSSNAGGGFGSNANTNPTSGAPPFGGNTSTASPFGGFGASNNNNTTSPFGAAKPAFGAPAPTSSGGGMFGSNTSTTGGFGGGGAGFGATSNNASTGFGSNAGGGLFGQSKPAAGGFGSSNTGGSLFGGGGGNTNASGGFGTAANSAGSNLFSANANTNTGFGASTANSGGGFGGFGATNTASTNNNQGTAAVPFQAFNEKDGTTSSTQAYQSITFQDPYKNKSFEELRTEDYAQGRRFGNSNGQAGSFGQSTGFGGFGATANTAGAGNAFGANSATNAGSNAFGGGFGANPSNNNAASSPFGNNTGGGLFGSQNKPATGGLFGNNATSGATTGGFGGTAGSGGGLFGSNPGGGFGSTNTAANTGGGLFGSNSTQQQQPQQNNTFGAATNAGGSLFGSQPKPAGGGLFGSSNANPNPGGSVFGNANTQTNASPFDASTSNTASVFGGNNNSNQQQQNKPAFGSFGQSANTGGAFGTSTNAGGGLFANATNQGNTGSGVFGGQNQNKPAGTGLFGASTSNTSGGGLFGGANNNSNNNQGGGSLFGGNQNSGGSLFGNAQNKPATSLFGNNTNNANTGGGLSLFGGNGQQNQNTNAGSSLFSNLGNSQNQQNAGNSLFGSSTNQQQQQPNQLHASIGGSPYGNEQLFASLVTNSPPIGPLATPLNARPAPRKTPSLMASMRLNTPVYTPRASSLGRTGGYGFSYSTYGTPGSAFSGSLTPGASSLLRPTSSLGSVLASRLNKSVSMSNLRADGTPTQPSLLRGSALSPGQGSMRKLRIDRSLRTDLFGSDSGQAESSREEGGQTPRKRVSWDAEEQRREAVPEPSAENALVRTEDTEQEELPGLLRGPPRGNGSTKAPEMSQTNGSGALSTVPEDEVSRPSSAPTTKMPAEKTTRRHEMGEYYTTPSLRDLNNMSRAQLQKVGKFTVGREGVGRIHFGNGQTVDLTTTTLEDICGKIVQLNPRSATVYLDDNDKPAMGKALNVPSTIALENSWPRSHGGRKAVHAKEGKEYDKHIARLRRVGGTKFQSYDSDTGVWTFTVDHFTTYGLDDDDEDDETEMQESSALSEPPATPGQPEDETMHSIETETGDVDDTFEFKLAKRSQQSVPGGFDDTGVTYDYDEDEAIEDERDVSAESPGTGLEDPFTSSGGAVQAPSPGALQRYHSSIVEEEHEMGEVDMPDDAMEDSPEMPGSFAAEPKMPRSILKPSTGLSAFASPEKLATASWEEQLQRTISPRKRDRQALKDEQGALLRQTEQEGGFDSPFKQSMLARSALNQSYLAQKSAKKGNSSSNMLGGANTVIGRSQAFKTSMDIMNSLWANEKTGGKAGAGGKGFELPYPKKARPSTSGDRDMDPLELEWHENIKPSFDASGTVAYSAPGSAPPVSTPLVSTLQPLVGVHHDVRFAKFVPYQDVNPVALRMQKDSARIEGRESEGEPCAITTPAEVAFGGIADQVNRTMPSNPSSLQAQELALWQLCSLLFDKPQSLDMQDFAGMSEELIKDEYGSRIALDAFKRFWATEVASSVDAVVKQAKTAEEKALLLLAKNDVRGACDLLTGAADFRLAMLVAQLPGTQSSRKAMGHQIEAWRKRKDWSEMSEAVRALYCILAGEICLVPGQAGPAEDRTNEKGIAEAFGMSWQQSFALRIFFGGYGNLSDAIRAYCADLDSEREHVKPITVWEKQSSDGSFADTADTSLGLLRLFIDKDKADASKLLEPLSVSGSAFSSRVAWQLCCFLSAKGLINLPAEAIEQLTLDYAVELEAAGDIVTATWTLQHLRDDDVRKPAITSLLERNAGAISDPTSGSDHSTFTALTEQLRIPTSLIFAAKATYAKSVLQDPYLQARWLLRANGAEDAHEVLCTTVGPQAVIEQDYSALRQLIHEFPRRKPEGWQDGGHVYESCLRLLSMPAAQKQSREGERALRELRKGLGGMEGSDGVKTLEQRVAMIEMRRLAEEIAREMDVGEEVEGLVGTDGHASSGMGMLEAYRRALGTCE